MNYGNSSGEKKNTQIEKEFEVQEEKEIKSERRWNASWKIIPCIEEREGKNKLKVLSLKWWQENMIWK